MGFQKKRNVEQITFVEFEFQSKNKDSPVEWHAIVLSVSPNNYKSANHSDQLTVQQLLQRDIISRFKYKQDTGWSHKHTNLVLLQYLHCVMENLAPSIIENSFIYIWSLTYTFGLKLSHKANLQA